MQWPASSKDWHSACKPLWLLSAVTGITICPSFAGQQNDQFQVVAVLWYRHFLSQSAPGWWCMAELYDTVISELLDMQIPVRRVSCHHWLSCMWFGGNCHWMKLALRMRSIEGNVRYASPLSDIYSLTDMTCISALSICWAAASSEVLCLLDWMYWHIQAVLGSCSPSYLVVPMHLILPTSVHQMCISTSTTRTLLSVHPLLVQTHKPSCLHAYFFTQGGHSPVMIKFPDFSRHFTGTFYWLSTLPTVALCRP